MLAWVAALITSWLGLARPSWRTATASPPQMSLAPDRPKWRQRRTVLSLGRPSGVPSQPSIGWIANRLPTVSAPTVSGDASGAPGPDATSSSQGMSRPRRCRCSRKPALVCSALILGMSPNFIGGFQ